MSLSTAFHRPEPFLLTAGRLRNVLFLCPQEKEMGFFSMWTQLPTFSFLLGSILVLRWIHLAWWHQEWGIGDGRTPTNCQEFHFIYNVKCDLLNKSQETQHSSAVKWSSALSPEPDTLSTAAAGLRIIYNPPHFLWTPLPLSDEFWEHWLGV